MRIAVIADIHGNIDALEAVLADMARHRVESAINLGDHVSGPLAAARTADRLVDLDFPTIRGNHDRWLTTQAASALGPSDRVAAAELTDPHRAWLAALPATLVIDGQIFACHGTPTSDTTYWTEHVASDGSVQLKSEAEISEIATGLEMPVILCGHTHIPRLVRLAGGGLLVNPGSVGLAGYLDDQPVPHAMQTGSPHARYAVLEHMADVGWDVTYRSVPYDSEAMAELAEAGGRAEWARALRTGWVR